MSQAIQDSSTLSTRRATLGFGIAAGLMTASVLAASQDASIIRICNRLLENAATIDALHAVRTSIEAETRTDPQLNALYDQQNALTEELEDAGTPTTIAGAKALTTAALRLHSRWANGDLVASDAPHWMALTALETFVQLV